MKKLKKRFNVDEHLKMISELAKDAPEPEEILAEFARGDYSSLDSEFLKGRNVKKKKTVKKGTSASKRREITL
jgi:hypothetical protein